MKRTLFLFLITFAALIIYAQSSKEVKKLKIKAIIETSTIGDKTLNEKKTVFDKNGDETEETDYNKEGLIKKVTKYKRNADGKVIEEAEYNAKNELKEKRTATFNKMGEKIEELFYDANSKLVKKYKIVYNAQGLKTEKQIYDGTGKLTETKKFQYEYFK